jgi:hypothetical protein
MYLKDMIILKEQQNEATLGFDDQLSSGIVIFFSFFFLLSLAE